jgi:hypothetical protein
MITSVLIASVLVALQGVSPFQQHAILVGWADELDQPGRWSPLGVLNQARLNVAEPGKLLLSLGQVPTDWPYTYQWGGFAQDATVDVARFPVLMARVLWVVGYAHMDIDVLDGNGKAVKTIRSSTLNGPGISTIDLSGALDPATYHLRLRLIVGGQNSGCSATYDWVRFLKKDDADFMSKNPNWPLIRPYWITLR